MIDRVCCRIQSNAKNILANTDKCCVTETAAYESIFENNDNMLDLVTEVFELQGDCPSEPSNDLNKKRRYGSLQIEFYLAQRKSSLPKGLAFLCGE